jgi:3-phenylpropionate/cinnamic acid dioxygenase small subunit
MSNAATEIANLLYTYARLIDSGDYKGVAKIFAHARLTAEDGVMDVQGEEAIEAYYAKSTRLYSDTGTPKTKHVMSNPIIEVDEAANTATCNAYYTVLQATDALALQPIIAGRYEDKFERVDGRWRYAEKKFFVELVGDLSQHLMIDLGDARNSS